MTGPPEIEAGDMRKLKGFVRRRVGRFEDAEDILQEVFLAFYARWNLGDIIEDAAAWMFKTAARRVVDWYRRKKRAPVSLDAPADPDLDGRDLWRLADAKAETPDEAAEREELRKRLVEAMDELPPQQRAVLLWNEIDGMTFREIEEKTGVPLNTLLSRKRYAIRKLRASVERYRQGRKEV